MNTSIPQSLPRPLARFAACVLALASLATAPRLAAEENLFPEGHFESERGRAAGWTSDNPSQSWLLDRFVVMQEGHRSFIRSTLPPASIKIERRVKPEWKELELRLETRRLDVLDGENTWDAASAELDFLGADGKSLLTWRKANWFWGEQSQWKEFTRRYPVPEGAVTLVLRVGNRAPGGRIDFSNVSVVVTEPIAE